MFIPFQPQKVQKSEAEINEALRIQAEKNLVLQQQKILEQQPFALDGGRVRFFFVLCELPWEFPYFITISAVNAKELRSVLQSDSGESG